MNVSMIFSVLITFILFKYIFNMSHLIISLLSLEVISSIIFFIYFMNIYYFNFDIFFMLYFIIMLVSEGVIGLCLLILMNFMYGHDYMFNFNSLLC